MFCNCCKKELPEGDFFPNRKKGGCYPVCKNCRKEKYYKGSVWRKKGEYKYFELPTAPLVLKIANETCELFGIGIRDLYSDCRIRAIAYARAYMCQWLRDNTSLSTLQIGKMVYVDHSVVLRNCNQMMREKVNNFLNKSLKKSERFKKVCNYKTGEIMYVKA